MTIAPSLYPLFCGCLPWVSITPHYAPMVASFHVQLVLACLVAWISSVPGGDFFTGVAAKFGVAYWAVSVSLNTILTCMICYRIVLHGRKVREHLGHEYASLYFGIVALVVESVLPCTLSGISFLASLGLGSPTSVTFICVYFMMVVCDLAMSPAAGASSAKRDMLVHIPTDVDPSSAGGESMGQRYIQASQLNNRVQSWWHVWVAMVRPRQDESGSADTAERVDVTRWESHRCSLLDVYGPPDKS